MVTCPRFRMFSTECGMRDPTLDIQEFAAMADRWRIDAGRAVVAGIPQLIALARIRAVEGLPVSRGPANR